MNHIRFYQITHPLLLSDFLQQNIPATKAESDFLIQLGAIYRQPAEVGQSTQPAESIQFTRSKTFHRLLQDEILHSGDILRCHTKPRRFPIPSQPESMIHWENEDFVIVNKPAGLPTQPSLDNQCENVLYQMSLVKTEGLFITHRLDVGTEGLLFLAKNEKAQRSFNTALEKGLVNKTYEAFAVGPLLQPQQLTHWMLPHKRAPKVLSHHPEPNWRKCQLEILSSKTRDRDNGSNKLNHYQIRLLTGRTHQIRAQLATEGNPLLGDQLYGGTLLPFDYEWHALKCTHLEFMLENKHYKFTLDALCLPNNHILKSIHNAESIS